MEPLVAETDIAPPPALALRSSALRRLPGGGTAPTVWSEFGDLARRVDASGAFDGGVANLGQGFPDWAPPQFVKTARARRATTTTSAATPTLSEVAVTVGATQALLVSLLATLAAGDEVVIPEPFFDLYLGQIKLAEGVARPAPMTVDGDGEWRLTEAVLRGAITPKSRVLVVNSPHNPTGKVFDRDELEMIARVVREENARRERDRVGDEDDTLLVIADEVYKYITHDANADHVHFASLPGMRDVTLTVSSAGKTFSATGWQIGWIVGPARLVAPCQTLLPYLQFCAPTPMQAALADCLDEADRPHKGQPKLLRVAPPRR
ncbi:transferase [Aureococcus anophagefferens]|nr:transferase [Aureococcus anophagefferens]